MNTRLAVCNCLSFTFRSKDFPSLLMAIFLFSEISHDVYQINGNEV